MHEESVIRLGVQRPESFNGIGKYFQGWSSRLGDYLLPGEDFYDREDSHCVSELITHHCGVSTLQTFLILLETLTLEMFQHSIDNPDWSTAQTASRWENTTKKLIRQRIERRFADAGAFV